MQLSYISSNIIKIRGSHSSDHENRFSTMWCACSLGTSIPDYIAQSEDSSHHKSFLWVPKISFSIHHHLLPDRPSYPVPSQRLSSYHHLGCLTSHNVIILSVMFIKYNIYQTILSKRFFLEIFTNSVIIKINIHK